MTEEQRAAMKDLIDNRAVQSAIYIKNYCTNLNCEDCIFYGQVYTDGKECIISLENPFGRTVPPEDWEV